MDQAAAYDPFTNSWLALDPMDTERFAHTATALADGRVLIVGGIVSAGNYPSSAEVYDSASGWSLHSNALFQRSRHTATRLSDGTILLVGGSNGPALSSAAIFNPTSSSITAIASLGTARSRHTATLLLDGQLLVAGGDNAGPLTSVELWNGVSWTTADALEVARRNAAAVRLLDGRVLITGGVGTGGTHLSSAEIYDPASDSWTLLTATMGSARSSHEAQLLPDGRVLIIAGTNGPLYWGTTEVFDPTTNTFAAGPDIQGFRASFPSITLPNGNILIAGGGATNPAAELYDVALESWISAP
jgi:hypothetical protein